MRAVCWTGINDLQVETVPDPELLLPTDAIVRVTMSSVCGSDLHLIHGYVPTMREGDILGHEFLGEVVEVGEEVQALKPRDRVVVMSIIGCGGCWYCRTGQWSLCDNSNTHPELQEVAYGHTTAGIFGYSHALGGYAGSHAEYIRVPFADHGAFKIPDEIPDEQALFVSDAAPTGYMGAEMCGIEPGDVVAVWGCGGVGQMAIRSAFLFGAERVIAIDRVESRLQTAHDRGGAETINAADVDVAETLKMLTGGRGPDRCIDAVGMEAVGDGLGYLYDRTKHALRLESDRPAVLREIIKACRKGGTVSIVGVYGGVVDKFPIGAAMNKALTLRMGQQFGQRYAERLFGHIIRGELDPSYLITHRMSLEDGPRGYELFSDQREDCLRVVFQP